jgi:hypothetical protein
MKVTTHLYVVPRSTMEQLYLHFHIHLPAMILNQLSTGTTLPNVKCNFIKKLLELRIFKTRAVQSLRLCNWYSRSVHNSKLREKLPENIRVIIGREGKKKKNEMLSAY